MISSIAVVVCIAIGAIVHVVVLRVRPFSEDFELNPIYHSPPSKVKTAIKPYEDVVITIEDIRRTMQLATILAKPDYALAKNPEKYLQILNLPEVENAIEISKS